MPGKKAARGSAQEELSASQVDNERYFCAAVLHLTHDAARSECGWLKPEWFVDERLGRFWQRYLDTGDPIRAANDAGVTNELAILGLDSPYSVRQGYQEHARAVAEGHYLRSVIAGLSPIVRSAVDKDVPSVRQQLRNLADESPVMEMQAKTAAQVDAEFRVFVHSGFPCVKTCTPLDNYIGGLFGDEMTILAGRPGTGKSAFAMFVARSVVANNKDAVVLFVSLEMSRMQLWARMACPLAGYSWNDLRAGNVDMNGKAKIEQVSSKLQATYADRLLIQDESWTLAQVHELVAHHRPNLVIVDHLGEMDWHKPDDSPVIWYGDAAKYMRQFFARTLGCHVLLLHQLNRGVEERSDKRPLLADLRWSGELEQRADIVLMLYRDDMYMQNVAAKIVPVELWIRKNRQGETNACVMMNYDLERQWFTPFGRPQP